ncbi:MAG: hypothetical protein Q7R39_07125, partial [Dehalococcoidia bacterium]|nr:hypothetical protein [Dehalococcoidia bacterium]
PNTLSALSYVYGVRLDPEPARLNQDIVLRLPYEPGGLSEPPVAAFFDSTLGDFVQIESSVAGGYVNITLEAGDDKVSSSSQAGVKASALSPPGASPPVGQKLRAAFNTIGSSLWWVTGLPNQKLEDDNFLVLYNTRDGTTEAYAQKLLDALDHSRWYLKGLDYAVPSGQVIVKTAPWVTRLTESEGFAPGLGTLSNWYIFFNDKLSDDEIRVTTAHELFHVIQMENMSFLARALTVPAWWREGTGTWAEYAVYPDVKTYTDRLPAGGDFVKIGFDDWSYLGASQQYATVAFAIYLEEKKGQGSIKQVFGRMGALTPFALALAEVTGDLPGFLTNFLKDFWMQNYGPAKTWGMDNLAPTVYLKAPATTVVNLTVPALSSGMVRVYYYEGQAPNPPDSFSQASGSVARMSLGCGKTDIYVLDASKSQLAKLSSEGSHVLDRLDSYEPLSPLYFLYVNSDGLVSCDVTVVLETPSISWFYPNSIPVSQLTNVVIDGGGFGPMEGKVTGGNVTSWSGGSITVGMTPGSAGEQPLIVETAEGVRSNPKTITVYVPTPTPTPAPR